MDANTKLYLENLIRVSQEVGGTAELTGRTRGEWAEVLEEVSGEDDVYGYWVQVDPTKAAGYRISIPIETSPTLEELDDWYEASNLDL